MGVGLPSVYAVGSRGRFGEAASIPSFVAPGLAVEDDGDGSVTIDVTPNQLTGGGDQVSRLKYRKDTESSYTVYGTSFTGDVADHAGLTGLTQGATYEFRLVPYDASSGAEGPSSIPVRLTLKEADEAMIDQIIARVVAVINAAGLTDANSVAITATSTLPPEFTAVNTAVVKVYPDRDPLQPSRNKVNERKTAVNVALCARLTDGAGQANALKNRQLIQKLFVGKRLDGLPGVYCEGETAPTAVDLNRLWEQFGWISPLALEFTTLEARG